LGLAARVWGFHPPLQILDAGCSMLDATRRKIGLRVSELLIKA
jgi:hypothetical protein